MTTMHRVFRLLLILLGMSALFGKYIYIEEKLTWQEAQYYCRQFHTDLAPISSNKDRRSIQNLATELDAFWIGLERNGTDWDTWIWSGGGEVTDSYWGQWEPQHIQEERYGLMHRCYWYNAPGQLLLPFCCYSVHVVREEKTWEEALEYCREHHRDLASVTSKTEMMLIQGELSRNNVTEHVWVGLRFLAGSWVWTDGRRLKYEAWGQRRQPSCPETELACGALQATQDSTGAATTTASGATQTPEIFFASRTTSHTYSEKNVSRERVAAGGVEQWQTRNCEEKLHFICY